MPASELIIPLARRLVRAISPSLHQAISHRRNRVQVERVERRLLARYGAKVVGGPFAGMEYVRQSAGSSLAPKLLGCYEEELHPFLERVLARQYPSVIVVGAAEGYYAVGLALRLPGAQVVAFDGDPVAQRLCAEMAARNSVGERVVVRGFCDSGALREILTGGTLVLCDCEGYERELLNPRELPLLRSCDLVVETHEWLAAGVGKLLSERFRPTHETEWVQSGTRVPGNYPELQFLRPKERWFAVQEFRPAEQRWLLLTARISARQ